MEVDKINRILDFWDLSGKEVYGDPFDPETQGADAIVFVYSINNQRTLTHLSGLLANTRGQNRHQTYVLLGSKRDLEDCRMVPVANGQHFARQMEAKIFTEVSSKTDRAAIFGDGRDNEMVEVKMVFRALASKLLEKEGHVTQTSTTL